MRDVSVHGYTFKSNVPSYFFQLSLNLIKHCTSYPFHSYRLSRPVPSVNGILGYPFPDENPTPDNRCSTVQLTQSRNEQIAPLCSKRFSMNMPHLPPLPTMHKRQTQASICAVHRIFSYTPCSLHNLQANAGGVT